jgi:hypothetical protein
MSRSLTLQRWLLPPVAAALAMALQVGASQAQTNPSPQPPAQERVKLTENQKQELFKARRGWALRDNAARMAVLQQSDRCVQAATDLEALRRCLGDERMANRRLMETTRNDATALAQRLGIPMPEGRGEGKRGRWGNTNTPKP